jgi:heavy metal translocating P-type ATPase
MKVRLLIPSLTLIFLIVGGALAVFPDRVTAHQVWTLGVILLGAPIVFETLRNALKGRFATDVVASLSIIGSVALDQPLAGLVIVLMQSGGEALERYAEGRASAAVRALEEAAPRIAHRVDGERVTDIPVTDIVVGEDLLVRPGELIPCDGIIVGGESELDTSSLTGEPVPVVARPGVGVMSGTTNGFGPLRIRATALAAESQYARIVELVRTAQASKAPLQRLADKYAVWFTPITLALCAVVVGVTHDWIRALSILVVATPCPLILATPVAIVGGINRAARRNIIIRPGRAHQQMSSAKVAVFDKTGTITIGKPRVTAVHVARGFSRDDVMRWAASVEQGSSHLLARVLVEAAEANGIHPIAAERHTEAPGQGVYGIVDGHEIRVGARAYVLPHCDGGVIDAAELEHSDATLRAYVAVDQRLAAVVEYADEIRADLPRVLAALRDFGFTRTVLLSGDHAPIARAVAERAGIPETYGDLLPTAKAEFIERLRAENGVVMMVGDGVNDAPALSAADAGVALAGHGGGVTTEAADVIILIDSLDRVADALGISRRTMAIARQSIRVGLGLSGLFMIVAAFGVLPPVIGAGVQEVIDVAVILNALRSSQDPRGPRGLSGQSSGVARKPEGRNEALVGDHAEGVSPLRA